MAAPAQFPFPVWLLAVDFVGMALLVLGLAGHNGLLGPAFAAPTLAWGLVTSGAALAVGAAAMILIHLRDRAAARRPH